MTKTKNNFLTQMQKSKSDKVSRNLLFPRCVCCLPISLSSCFLDIYVCTRPDPTDTPFSYAVTSFKDVKCVGKGSNSFDITFGGTSLSEIGTADDSGTNSFVFVLQENFVESAGYEEEDIDRTLACSGKAVITASNSRNGRVLEVSFGDSSRSLQAVGDIQESDFEMSMGIEDSAAAAASARLLSVATAIGSVICAFFIM